MVPGDKWVTAWAGETQWCAFDDLDGLPAEVLLDVEPGGRVAFRFSTEGEESEPVNDLKPGDLFWSGRLGRPGCYHVVVQHQSCGPGTHPLKIVGA